MDTSLTVRNMRRQSWALMLQEQSASGLSIKDWCEQEQSQHQGFLLSAPAGSVYDFGLC